MNSPCRLALIFGACLASCTPISLFAQSPVQDESAELSAARVRAALVREREAIARNPNDPKGYIDLAYTLTDAGIGDQAQQQALKAVQLAPGSPFAQSARGWVLHHNLIGVDYGLGFDYDATLASLGKAVELDPNDLSNQQSLAELLEHNRNGIRYAPDAHLDRTIEIYNFIRSRPNGTTKEIDSNYVIILFQAGRLKEALTEISRVPRTPMLNGIAIAALAVTRGIPEALTFANQIGGDEQNKKEALKFAAEGLWNMRLYPQAAEVLTAALPDPEEGPQLVGKIQLFHTLKPYQPANLPATDPRAPVQRLITAEILDELTDDIIEQTVSSHTLLDPTERKQAFASVAAIHGRMQTLSRQAGLPQAVVRDIVFGSIRIAVMPSQAAGARILLQLPGSKPQGFFVIQEDGVYKIAASSSSMREVGAEALYLLRHGRAAEAESLLDWKRTFIQRDQSEDEYGGVLFSRLWLIGATKEHIDIELAAASLITDKPTLLTLLPGALEARKKATRDGERDRDDLLLAHIYLQTGDGANAEHTARELLARAPDSDTAIGLLGSAYRLQKNLPAWRTLLESNLKRRPQDRALLKQAAIEAEVEGDYTRARRSYASILESGQATSDDSNIYAWLSLFDNSVDEPALAAAQQANLQSKEENPVYLHTLACLNAAVGRAAEARQLLLQEMTFSGLELPDSAAWYGFGRIYEQYGVYDAAIAAYRKVTKPEGELDPLNTYVLAQARMAKLRAQ